ncbi:MAG: GAF domain-containing protein [Calditrichaeota bacterium]|nr:GAF domain-containing protein [Calditrichota bacterium]
MGVKLEFAFSDVNRALQTMCTLYPFWEETAMNLSRAPTEVNTKNVIDFSTKLTQLLFSVRSLSKYTSQFAILNQKNDIVAKEPPNSRIINQLPVAVILDSQPDSIKKQISEGAIYWVDLSDYEPESPGYMLAMKTFRMNGEKNTALLVFNFKALLEDITPVRHTLSGTFFILDPLQKTVVLFSHLSGGPFTWQRLSLDRIKADKKRIFQKILKTNDRLFHEQNDSLEFFARRQDLFSWRTGLFFKSDAYFLPIEAKWKMHDRLRKKSLNEFKYFLFFLAFVLFIISGLMARIFQRPLQRLIDAAQRIKSGQIQQKIPPGRIKEFSQLIDAFNDMSVKLHTSLQKLSHSENRYRALVEEAGEAILVFSSDGKVVTANHACSELLVIPPEELAQKNVSDIFSNLPFLEYTTQKKTNIPLELTYRQPGGKLLRIQVKPTRIELQEKVFYQVIIHNLTQQKEFEQKLVEQNRFLSLTNAITGLILSRNSLQEIYETSLHLLMEAQNAVLGLIYLFDPSTESFSLVYSIGTSEKWIEEIQTIDKHSMTYEVIKYKKPVYVEDILSDSRLSPKFRTRYFEELGIQGFMGIPLLSEGIPFGVISLGLPGKTHLNDNKKWFLESVGAQIGLVIRHFTSVQLETKRATQLDLLSQGLKIWAETGNFREVLQKSVDFIHDNLGYWHVAVFFLDKKKNRLKLEAISGGLQDVMKEDYIQELGTGIMSQVIRTKKTYYAPNAEKDPHYFKYQDIQAKSELAVPLRLHDEIIGVVNIEEMEYEAFDSVDISTIEAFSEQLAIYYEFEERIRLEKSHARQMELVSSLGAIMNSQLDSIGFIRELAKELQQKFGHFLVSVYLVSAEDKDVLIKVADSGGTPSKWPIGKKVPIGQGLLGLAAKTREIVCVNNVSREPRFIPVGENITGSELCAPILFRDHFLGVLNIETMETDAFHEFEIHAIQTLANQMAQAIHNARLYEQLKYEKGKMDQILSEMGEGVAMTDHQWKVLYLNPVFKNQFPATRVGKDGARVFPFLDALKKHPDFDLLWEGKRNSLFIEFSHDGKILLITVSQFLDFDFSKYFLFLVKDITEIKQYESEKIKSERLTLAIEMAGSIAHEINQPLTGILGYLALIKEDLKPEDPLMSDLQEVEKQAERISDLVKKFRNVVKIETKTYIGDSKIIDLEQSTQNNQGKV